MVDLKRLSVAQFCNHQKMMPQGNLWFSPVKKSEQFEPMRFHELQHRVFHLDTENIGSFSAYALLANAPPPKPLPRSISRSSSEELSGSSRKQSSSDFDPLIQNDSAIKSPRSDLTHTPKSKQFEWKYSCDQIGIYDIEERRLRIEQYRQKRKQLNFHQVRYYTRSNICQKRQRVGGRFVKTATIIRADRPSQEAGRSRLGSTSSSSADTLKSENADTDLSLVAETMLRMSRHSDV